MKKQLYIRPGISISQVTRWIMELGYDGIVWDNEVSTHPKKGWRKVRIDVTVSVVK